MGWRQVRQELQQSESEKVDGSKKMTQLCYSSGQAMLRSQKQKRLQAAEWRQRHVQEAEHNIILQQTAEIDRQLREEQRRLKRQASLQDTIQAVRMRREEEGR